LFDLIAQGVQLNVVVPNTVAANAAVEVNAKEGSGIIGLVLYAGLQALLEQNVKQIRL
jgi:hypothetical protein